MIQVTKKIIKFILQDRNKIPTNPKDWPESWKTVNYKTYTKIIGEKIIQHEVLQKNQELECLSVLLKKRTSSRNFNKIEITDENIIQLLSLASGTKQNDYTGRTYPSGGALYPVETYYLNLNESTNGEQTFKKGLYHFSPFDNSLSCIKTIEKYLTQESLIGSSYTFTNNASGFIILTLTPKRNVPKYGWLGVRLGLIEIGEVIQNIYIVCSALNIKCCALAGFNAEKTDELLDIDGLNEMSIITIAVG